MRLCASAVFAECSSLFLWFLLWTRLLAASVISLWVRPYFFSNSLGCPLSPNLSLMPMNRCGVGCVCESNSAMAPPSPAVVWCSSMVTTAPHFLAVCMIVFVSSGLMVWLLMTVHCIPSLASSSAASSASYSSGPQAMSAQSFPSRYVSALPMWNAVRSVVMMGVFSRVNLRYVGPWCCAAASVALRVSMASQGTMTVMFGRVRVSAMSSRAWWVAPSGPTLIPACAPAILTFWLL